AFEGFLARLLRLAGALLVLVAGAAVAFGQLDLSDLLPPWAAVVYPLVLAVAVAVYGLTLAHRPSLGVAGLVVACWLATGGWQGYCSLRRRVMGLDHIAMSLGLFGMGILVSLAKSGALARWLASRWRQVPVS